MNKIKYIFFLLFLITINSCKLNNQGKIKSLKSLKIKNSFNITKDDNFKQHKITLMELKRNIVGNINERKDVIALKVLFIKDSNNYILISKNNCVIKILDTAFNEIKSFNFKGKEYGQINFVNSAIINRKAIYLYDSQLKKLLVYNKDGVFLREKYIVDAKFPYNITSIVKANNSDILLTGMSLDEWIKYNKNNAYNNIYLVDLENQQVINAFSLLSNFMIKAIKNDDVISSNVSSPFQIIKDKKEYYLFNMSDNIIFKFKIINNNLNNIEKIKLSKEILKLHQPMKRKKYNDISSNNHIRWSHNGSYLLQIFTSRKYLFLYGALYNIKKRSFEFQIFIINKFKLKLETKLFYYGHLNLYYVNGDDLYFMGYKYPEDKSDNILQIYKYNIAKLF